MGNLINYLTCFNVFSKIYYLNFSRIYSGLLVLTEYYNNVNEFVGRLQKLEASKQAGNNTQNKIINILKELEGLGVINDK